MKSLKIRLSALFMSVAILVTSLVMPAASVAAETEAADLVITNVASARSEVYDGDVVKLQAIVRNSSATAVTEKFSVDFMFDGKLIQSVTYSDGLEARSRATVTTTFTYFGFFGAHKISAKVNASGRVAESSYDNNYLSNRMPIIDSDTEASPALPVEKTAVKLPKKLTVEAEDATVNPSSKILNTVAGYKGKGYVTVFSGNDGFTATIDAPVAGKYRFYMRYSTNTKLKARLSFKLNDTKTFIAPLIGQVRTGSWINHETDVELVKGKNVFKFFLDTNDYGNALIDSITLEPRYSKSVDSFNFLKENNPKLPADIKCSVTSNQITAYIPSDLDVTDLVATYSTKCTSVTVQGAEQKSGVTHNDFTNGHYYTFTDKSGSRTYPVKLIRLSSNNLPNMYVNFGSDVSSDDLRIIKNGVDKEDKSRRINCTYNLTTSGNVVLPYKKADELKELTDVSGTINLRGNSSLGVPKKSYKVKFTKKNAILDMEKSKSWVLLACYGDKSLMRDYTGHLLGQSLDAMGYSPDMRYVNLFLDGEYKGLYMIGEGAKIGKGRLDLADIDEKSTDITGGYIIEVDGRRDEAEKLMFTCNLGKSTRSFTIKEPNEDIVTDEMRNYIQGYVQQAFDAIIQAPENDEYEKYIDVDSFVDWYIGIEISKSRDATGLASIYLHKDAGGKLAMGPMWDFVPGFGCESYKSLDDNDKIIPGSIADTSGFWIKGSLWWGYLFKNEKFVEKVKARWQELYATGFDGIIDKTKGTYNYIRASAWDNFNYRWDLLDKYVWDESYVLHSYDAYADEFINWLDKRIEWLNTQYGK